MNKQFNQTKNILRTFEGKLNKTTLYIYIVDNDNSSFISSGKSKQTFKDAKFLKQHSKKCIHL